MNLLLEVAWITQVSDWLTLNWLKLLGIFGGAGGFIAFITMIGKLLIACVQGHYSKKYSVPLHKEVLELKQNVMDLTEEIKMLKILIENSSDSNKEELKEYFKYLIARSQKLKVALYDKMTTSEDNIQNLLNSLNDEIKETENLIDESKNEPAELPVSHERNINEEVIETTEIKEQEQISVENEPKKRHKRKTKKVIVER